MPEQLNHEKWTGKTDGTRWMHQALIRMFKYIDVRVVYVFMAIFVIPFYMLFVHSGYISMYHYFRQRRHYGAWKAFRYVYLNHYRFGQVILDRFAAYAGQTFQFELEGNELFLELSRQDSGFVIFSSHVGNYELGGYAFKSFDKPYNAIAYSGETQSVMDNRKRMLNPNNIRMISVCEDMSHVFIVNNALANGEIVSIPADRLFGSTRFVECDFLGAKAHFPLGPYALALQRGVPTIAIFIMKVSAYKYKGYIRRVEIDKSVTTKNRTERAAALAQTFVHELEEVLQRYPEQWFNYYEFWQPDGK